MALSSSLRSSSSVPHGSRLCPDEHSEGWKAPFHHSCCIAISNYKKSDSNLTGNKIISLEIICQVYSVPKSSYIPIIKCYQRNHRCWDEEEGRSVSIVFLLVLSSQNERSLMRKEFLIGIHTNTHARHVVRVCKRTQAAVLGPATTRMASPMRFT